MYFQKLIEQLFNIDSKTSATIIISLTVFLLGFVITYTLKGFERYFTRRANRKIFLKNLETLISSVNKRKELLSEQLAILKIDHFTTIPVGRIQFFQITVLNSIGHKTSFDCFFLGIENFIRCPSNKKIRSKAFLKVIENFANIEFWENNMYEQMLPAQTELNRLNEKMGIPLQQMRIFYSELFTRQDSNQLSVPEIMFVTEIRAIFHEWSSIEDRTIAFTVNEMLSKKIKAACDKYYSLKIARDLRTISMEAIHQFSNIEIIILSLTQSLTAYSHLLSYFSKSTLKIIKILN